MYILLALIAACALGIGLHFVLPKRDLRGGAVAPGIATAAAAAIYTMLQWAGVAETSAWLWFASLGGGLLLAAVLTVAISAVRTRRDAVAKQALGI